MRIAITQRIIENSIYRERRDALSHDWPRYLLNILPHSVILPIPNIALGLDDWINAVNFDAVLFSNGNDWMEAPERDQTEQILLEYALQHRIPVLGVCRGLQVINILFGGSIERKLASKTSIVHVGNEHLLMLIGNEFISLAKNDRIMVNSYHNQGVLRTGLAEKLNTFALAEDEVVEGLYHSELPVMAVQWHPERNGPSGDFTSLIVKKFLNEGAFWK